MSMPHKFTDDPNSFPGPPTNSSNTAVILVAIAVICGTLMLICGGVIFGVVMSVRQAQTDFVLNDLQSSAAPNQSTFQEYAEFLAEGRYAEALASVDADLASNPESAFLHNNKAWLLATCPDEAVRDGELAIEHATTACELTNWTNVMFLDTLAAAYAEADDFESAVKWQEEAIRLDTGAFAVDFQKRLRLFKAGKAYREGVAAYKDPAAEVSTEAEIPNAVKAETNKPATTDEATTQEETVQP